MRRGAVDGDGAPGARDAGEGPCWVGGLPACQHLMTENLQTLRWPGPDAATRALRAPARRGTRQDGPHAWAAGRGGRRSASRATAAPASIAAHSITMPPMPCHVAGHRWRGRRRQRSTAGCRCATRASAATGPWSGMTRPQGWPRRRAHGGGRVGRHDAVGVEPVHAEDAEHDGDHDGSAAARDAPGPATRGPDAGAGRAPMRTEPRWPPQPRCWVRSRRALRSR